MTESYDSIWTHSSRAPDALCLVSADGKHYSRNDVAKRIWFDSHKLIEINLHKEKGIALIVENTLSSLTVAIAAFQLGVHVLIIDSSIEANKLAKIVNKSGVSYILGSRSRRPDLSQSPDVFSQVTYIDLWSFDKSQYIKARKMDRVWSLYLRSGRLIDANSVLNGKNGFAFPAQLTLNRHEYASTYVGMQLLKGISPDSKDVQVIYQKLARPAVFFWALATLHSGNILVILDITSKKDADIYKMLYTSYVMSGSKTQLREDTPIN